MRTFTVHERKVMDRQITLSEADARELFPDTDFDDPDGSPAGEMEGELEHGDGKIASEVDGRLQQDTDWETVMAGYKVWED